MEWFLRAEPPVARDGLGTLPIPVQSFLSQLSLGAGDDAITMDMTANGMQVRIDWSEQDVPFTLQEVVVQTDRLLLTPGEVGTADERGEESADKSDNAEAAL